MARRKEPNGTCTYCAQVLSWTAMLKHLPACAQRKTLIEKSATRAGKDESLYHLRVRDAYGGPFWLDLEVRGSATLKQLDDYLRAIWLECCGHLSEFSRGGWGSEKISKTRSVGQVFGKLGVELTHIYDFGTESVTLIKAVGSRTGKPTTRHPIALMARNMPPEYQCIECKQPASSLCLECLIEENVWGTLCDAHARTHPHENYDRPMPLVNSPRLGMCGYTGPAEPPY